MASRPISPAEPTKKHPPFIQPNAHPYAIKTTSSALLSRSNSSPHTAHHTRHHYIPSQIPIGTRGRHRHSSSLSSVDSEAHNVNGVHTIPAPLPTPPPLGVTSPDDSSVSLKCIDELGPSCRVRRAETMPSGVMGSHGYDQKHKFNHDQDSGPKPYAGLPPNPKQWNTDQLAAYLKASFNSDSTTNRDRDDSSLVDILECVRARGLTGRELLRLTDADLVGTPLSDVQRTQLLERSRILRAGVLRWRIHVDSYHSQEVSDNSNNIYSQFHSNRSASLSADDLRLLLDNNSGSDGGVLPPSPVVSLHRSNSVSDASAQRYRDLARMRTRRRGRVKGLVETWERASTSGSERSTSDAETESETDPEFESISDSKHSSGSPYDLLTTVHDEHLCDVSSSPVDYIDVPQELPTSTPPPPYTHTLKTVGNEEEEPSIEELLASSSNIPLKGARAWEADLGLVETVKRVPVSASADASSGSPLVTGLVEPSHPKDDGRPIKGDSVRQKASGVRRSTGSKGKKAQTQRRIVTAIFTGSPTGDVFKNAGDEAHVKEHNRYASGAKGIVHDGVPACLDLQHDSDNVLRALEGSIAVTRIELEAFRLRLEKVEADTARQEARLERATPETAKPPEDGTLVQDVKNKNVFESPESMSLVGIARTIAARAVGWLFPYGHLGVHAPEDHDQSLVCPNANDKYLSQTQKNGRLPVAARMSCSIILVSFAVCAAILRKMGFGQWVRRP